MGSLSDLKEGRALEKRVMARRVAVFNHEGRLYGLEADCKHMRASLASGKVEDGFITCKWHGWKYNLETGECLHLKNTRLRVYEVTVDGDDVYLEV